MARRSAMASFLPADSARDLFSSADELRSLLVHLQLAAGLPRTEPPSEQPAQWAPGDRDAGRRRAWIRKYRLVCGSLRQPAGVLQLRHHDGAGIAAGHDPVALGGSSARADCGL